LNKNKFYNLINPLILLISIFLICIAIEGGTRIYYSKPLFELVDYRGVSWRSYAQGLPAQFNESLGWIPLPGFSGTSNMWGTEVTILKEGIRSNGNNLRLELNKSVLVVGDSFTFGDEVSNQETWPAILERLIRRPVINAGVFAYGTDQAFLRLKSLIPEYKPDTIIFSFIRRDIERCENSSVAGVNKPYFVIVNNSLSLMNVPVKNNPVQPDIVSRILGHSYFFHITMMKLNPNWWLRGGYINYENLTGYKGDQITCLLFKELETIVKANKIKHVYILIQQEHLDSPDTQTDYVLACLNKKIFQVIDLRKNLSEVKTRDESRYNSFFKINHMSFSGNQYVAEKIFHAMQENRN
jgi:hypothetical protein